MKMDTKNWEQSLIDNNIKYIKSINDIPEGPDVLWTTRCSKIKSGKNKALPEDFYVSSLNKLFYSKIKGKFRFGILSDLYGICMDDKELDFYDLHPSQLTDDDKKRLGKLIAEKCKKYGYKKIIFFNSSPLMSRPYFDMLLYSKLDIYFITNIHLVNSINNTIDDYFK